MYWWERTRMGLRALPFLGRDLRVRRKTTFPQEFVDRCSTTSRRGRGCVGRRGLGLNLNQGCAQSLSRVRLFAAPWTAARQSFTHGILQARILEWVAIYSSRGSS